MKQPYDWSRFVKRVAVFAAPETVYRAWTTQQGLESWFLRLAEFTGPRGALRKQPEFCQPGDHYKWLWHGWPDSTMESGVIKEMNGKDLLRFSFCSAGAKTDMQVTVRLKTEQQATVVELVQDNIPVEERGMVNFHLGCTRGWVFYLANLKSILEGGIDLRNKNELLENVINS